MYYTQGDSSKKKALGHSNSQGGENIMNSFEGRRGASGGHMIGAQRRIAGKEKRKWKLVAKEGEGQRFTGKKIKKHKKR